MKSSKEFDDLREALMTKMISITQKSKFLTTSDVSFFRTDLKIVKDLDALGKTLKESVNYLVKIGAEDENLKVFDGPDADHDFLSVIEVLDDIYEMAVSFYLF